MPEGLDGLLEDTPFVLGPDSGTRVLQAAMDLQNDVRLLHSQGTLEPETLAQLRREWGFLQVHESAAIEGNELTLSETQMAIVHGVTISGKPPKHSMEVRNLHNALESLESLARSQAPPHRSGYP